MYVIRSQHFQTILKKGKIGETYNIGCDDHMEYTVLEVAKYIVKFIKGDNQKLEEWIQYVEDRPFNDKRYYISNEKLRALGWEPTVTFETGLRELIDQTDACKLDE